jgi:MFS family permease
MQGRVMSLVISLTSAMVPLGLLIVGPLADNSGVNGIFIFASLIFVICGLFALINPDIRDIENTQKESTSKQESPVSTFGSTT